MAGTGGALHSHRQLLRTVAKPSYRMLLMLPLAQACPVKVLCFPESSPTGQPEGDRPRMLKGRCTASLALSVPFLLIDHRRGSRLETSPRPCLESQTEHLATESSEQRGVQVGGQTLPHPLPPTPQSTALRQRAHLRLGPFLATLRPKGALRSIPQRAHSEWQRNQARKNC